MLQRQLSHLTTAKFKPFIFFISGFVLSYIGNIFILMILYDFSGYVEYLFQNLFRFPPEKICHVFLYNLLHIIIFHKLLMCVFIYKCIITVRFVIVITQFLVTIATNCRPISVAMKVSNAANHERARILSSMYCVYCHVY
jgi:hypothetical protein